MKEPYSIEKVKELVPKIEKFLEINAKGYTYPEIMVAWQSALYTATYWQSKELK